MAKAEMRQQKGTQQHETERSRSRQEQRSEQGGSQTALSRRQRAMPDLFASPFSFMRRFGEGMEQLFSDFPSGGLMSRGFGAMASWTPQIEVFRREGQLVIRADLPGMRKDDVQVELRDDALVLRGERQEERREEREGFFTSERSYGRFYREIPLPDGVDPEGATANFRDGVLEILMPLEESQARGRKLEIQDSSSAEQGRQRAQAASGGR